MFFPGLLDLRLQLLHLAVLLLSMSHVSVQNCLRCVHNFAQAPLHLLHRLFVLGFVVLALAVIVRHRPEVIAYLRL